MQFVLNELGYLEQVSELPGCEDLGADLVDAILGEAGKFAQGVLSPLNIIGDREGACWHEGEVTTAKGWHEAYGQFVEGGWNALSCHPEFGGQGLPRLISALVEEMWNGANVSFGRTSPPCAAAQSPRTTARTVCSARRSSSPMASTT
jgi:alkylation response protein AidB-like acyl-CoA dehydrogenase